MAHRQNTSGSTPVRLCHILADRDGNILDASEHALACYRYSRAELLRMKLQDLCATESRPKMTEWFRGLLENGSEQETELEHQARDGRRFTVQASTWTPTVRNGRSRNFVFRDVTAERQIETAQRKSETELAEGRYYRFLTETMKDVVWVIDVQTMRFTYVSPSVERMRGFTAEEIMAAPVEDSLVPETRDYWIGMIHTLAAEFLAGRTPSDQFLTHEMEQPCKDGSTVWIEVVAHFHLNTETGHLEVHGVTRDISDRIKAQRARRESEANLQAIIESSSAMIWSVDPARFGLITYNQVLAGYLSEYYGVRIAPGMTPDEIFPPAQARQWKEYYRRVMQEGPFRTVHAAAHQRPSGPATLHFSFYPVIRDGQVFAVSVFGKDITDIRKMEENLAEKVAQLEAALAKVKQLEGIIPICMYCKKICDDEKSWHQLERYISAHSEAVFSHGICPECYEKKIREAKAGKKR